MHIPAYAAAAIQQPAKVNMGGARYVKIIPATVPARSGAE